MSTTKPRLKAKTKKKKTIKSLKKKSVERLNCDGKKNRKVGKAWILKLYVAGKSLKSMTAFNNLKALCEKHLLDQYVIEIIDLLEQPQLAKGDQIFAIPTLVRHLPQPIKKIIGDLSSTEKILVGLNIKVAGS